MVTGELADRLKIEIGYKPTEPKTCKYCKFYVAGKGPPPVDERCSIVENIGYFDVWEEATCNMFSKRS